MKLLVAEDFALMEERCLQVVRRLRWGNGVACPYCGSKSIHRYGRDKRGLQRYRCKRCGELFTGLSKTIFERSRLKLWQCFSS